MKKLFLITAVLFLGIIVISAQPNKMNMKAQSQKGEFVRGPYCQSTFTEEQQAKMQELRLEYAKNSLEIKNELKILTAEYNGMMTGDNQDLNAINKKIDQMQELKSELFKMHAKHRLDVRNLMTEEQKIQFDSKASVGRGNVNFGNCPRQAQGKPGMGRGPCSR
ncbi:MAG: periplasmic heavy metal sensor [Bacteroidales bacterium]|nr:periplasmic heavy metal sensor [Bacteroidales bacterium]MCF8391331.1 periplasmic heavy metal sensor [Bacteroidales bacterium]